MDEHQYCNKFYKDENEPKMKHVFSLTNNVRYGVYYKTENPTFVDTFPKTYIEVIEILHKNNNKYINFYIRDMKTDKLVDDKLYTERVRKWDYNDFWCEQPNDDYIECIVWFDNNKKLTAVSKIKLKIE